TSGPSHVLTHVSTSAGVGLLSGGAQWHTAVILTPTSRRSGSSSSGEVASPARCNARYSQSPERSPVNILPVRFPPWAAGARPTTRIGASIGPNEGTGRPQYSSEAKAARFSVVALRSRHSTTRGPRRPLGSPAVRVIPAPGRRPSPA